MAEKKGYWAYSVESKSLNRDDGMRLDWMRDREPTHLEVQAIIELQQWLNGGDEPGWLGTARRLGPFRVEIPVGGTIILEAFMPRRKLKGSRKNKTVIQALQDQEHDCHIEQGLLVSRIASGIKPATRPVEARSPLDGVLIPDGALDDLVHEMYSGWASNKNNEGTDAQLEFLLKEGCSEDEILEAVKQFKDSQ